MSLVVLVCFFYVMPQTIVYISICIYIYIFIIHDDVYYNILDYNVI